MITEDAVIQELATVTGRSVVRLLENVIKNAHARNASDIHIDPERSDIKVRFRVDGELADMYVFPKDLHAEMLARLKILAGLRTDEHFTPHDGRFRFLTDDEFPIDIRISIAPTYHGENAVLRLLSPFPENDDLKGLGLSADHYAVLTAALARPHGMILATGPTGSGKTTSMYALVKALNTRTRAIITIEDPVEYSLSGVSQIPVNPRTGVSFAQGLRSILRQDPDVIMIGEIRDGETASLGVNASLTGHLVLSTLHTNDASSTLPRLLDMQVEPYLIASTVRCIIAQRLVRRICTKCIGVHKILGIERQSLSEVLPEGTAVEKEFYIGKGCAGCNNTGYRGRIGIYEVLTVEGSVRDAIASKRSADSLGMLARKNGMIPMIVDGYQKAVAGVTTIEEILRMRYE